MDGKPHDGVVPDPPEGARREARAGKAGKADGLRAVCVSIHDVAPATWDDCARLAQALREAADLPLTWLVVPHYHRGGGDLRKMEAGLEAALARGDELALHGYTHLDDAPRGHGVIERFLRGAYSREGEFAALCAGEAARRIARGLDWFAQRGWPVRGFVPPAWLMGAGAWEALRAFDFDYTTTFSHFHLLGGAPAPGALASPSLVYAARNRSGRLASPWLADAIALGLAHRPLVRLGLHPPDLHHPRLLSHAQTTVARLAERRTPMTKAAFAARLRDLTSTDPSSLRPANHASPSPRSTRDRSA